MVCMVCKMKYESLGTFYAYNYFIRLGTKLSFNVVHHLQMFEEIFNKIEEFIYI